MINYTPKLFIVVGNPASGKDELIRAINSLGKLHADIIPKHTNRHWRFEDGNEMICKYIPNDSGEFIINPQYRIDDCEVKYENYNSKYGINTKDIWDGLKRGVHQVLVVSNIDALNKLRKVFGGIVVMIYIYSEVTKSEYLEKEMQKLQLHSANTENTDVSEYIKTREENFDMAWQLYEDNFMLFDHVFIFTAREEDLYDQIFRLFRYYENRN